MNFSVHILFLCSAVLMTLAQDSPPVVANPSADITPASHDHDSHDHDGHDHGDTGMDHALHDHSDMTTTATKTSSTSNNTSVKDPSAQGSTTGDAVSYKTCLYIVMLAAALPQFL